MCRPFFDARDQFPAEEVADLGDALKQFLASCAVALDKHKELIEGEEYLDMQEKLEGGLADLETTVQKEFIEGVKA